jgi:hypothetical protein
MVAGRFNARSRPVAMFRRRVATLELTPNIAFIVINGVLLQERFILLLKLRVSKESGVYATSELNYPSDKKSKYDCLNGLVLQKSK